MKGDEDREEISSPVSDTIALQSKVLSLELLLSVLEHSGPSFKSGSRFIDVIRQVLCESLLKNYVSTSGQVVSLSLKIFLALIRNFRVSSLESCRIVGELTYFLGWGCLLWRWL
jgi:Sec7-like guanine-nucleotide exchange factor